MGDCAFVGSYTSEKLTLMHDMEHIMCISGSVCADKCNIFVYLRLLCVWFT
jgi:hypothetical protein